MKKTLNIIIGALGVLSAASCANLDLNPLSAASSENWYSSPEEIRISLNDFYRSEFYTIENNFAMDRQTDDWNQRLVSYPVSSGLIDATTASGQVYIAKTWSYTYKNVTRANRIVESLDKLSGKYNEAELEKLRAEARFFRAYAYSRLVTLWGDVPFYLTSITPEEAFEMGRTDKKTVLEQIYKDFDYAAENLPVDNNSSMTRVDKGCALAFKARIALYQSDWETVAVAAKECMDLGKYSLYPDYGELFRDKTKNCEIIWSIPHSTDIEVGTDGTPATQSIKTFIARTAGGTHDAQPSWELLASYEMTNGKTIDEPGSGFDPHDPFKDRDPRCCETFAAPGTKIYGDSGIEWDPSPAILKTMDYLQGVEVTNKDSKGGSDSKNCSYNGCCLRKGAQPEWRSRLYNDNPVILMRYADVLLMYAEAKVELNKIDAEVIACINDVRARAYKVGRSETSEYPAVTVSDQASLRKIIRRERRVEFAWENRRYFDLQRWHQFENAFAHNRYGFSRNATVNKKAFADGKWFWPETPEFDEDGFPNFDKMAASNDYIEQHVERKFDSKVYLWPLPSDEIQIMNGKLEQNPGY